MFAQKLFLIALVSACLIGSAWSYAISHDLGHHYNDPHPQATATRIHNHNLGAVHHYGLEIGRPLLVKDYGHLTNLYSALAPKRAFIGTVDSGFYKDHHGHVKYRDETAIGAIAV